MSQGYPHICTGTIASLSKPCISHPTCCLRFPQTWRVAHCHLNYCCHHMSGLGDGAEDQFHDLACWHVDILTFSPTVPGHAVGSSSKNPQVLLGPESAAWGWGACSRNTTHVCTFCSVESQISSPPSEAPEMTHVPLGLETPRCTTFLCLYAAE